MVAGSDGKSDIFCGSDQIAPDHVDLGHENSPLCGSFDLFEPDGPDSTAGIEDGGDADFPGKVSVLDDGCHAGIMG